jgi:chromosome segregation protein
VHLSAIKLRGFKSFPDPVEIRLEPGVAVIVGPNGSGKSNVADAIVWAAGSLAPSELRAERADDVLFAGSADRPPADWCEVELLFDNADGGFEGIPFGEVSILRRLHRGGEGEYQLNRTPVRRLDLVELLSDVGLGSGMHAIVGQGKVEEILASKPEQRRALLEEAAGLGRYKQRRHRAELKLARVAADVERALDLEREVRARLRPLALQASAAERAARLAGEISALRATIAARELAAIEERTADAENRRTAAELARKRAERELEDLLGRRTAAEDELADAAGRREAATAALYRLRGAVERLALQRERADDLSARLGSDLAAAREQTPDDGPSPAELQRAAEEAAAAARQAAAARDDVVHRAELVQTRVAALGRALAEREGLPPAARLLAEAGERLALAGLDVDPGYERAVAAALAGRAAALLAADAPAALRLAERARADGLGTVTILSARRARPAPERPSVPAEPLAAHVRARPGAESVLEHLGDAWVVELDDLLKVERGVAVTREGHAYEPERAQLSYAGETAEAVLLKLAAEERALRREAAELDARVEEARRAADAAAGDARTAAALAAEAIAARPRPRLSAAAVEPLLRCVEELRSVLVDAERTGGSLEAPLRARVDAGGLRAAEVGATLRALASAEVDQRRRHDETRDRSAAAAAELAGLRAEAAAIRRRLEEAGGEARDDARPLDELTASLERLERRHEALGQVNPLAKEEYEREKERLDELSAQRADLEASLAEVDRLRAELTETVERRFAETFEHVRSNFSDVCGALFPGGDGRLRLTEAVADEAGVVDAEPGIEVELRPAGKRVTKLSLLSGGEKALGALAFLFSLFLARPSAFYLLDEVEAALDDPNIGRFIELLRRYAERAQFIVVTHQKRTMEAADVLYGVTMGADGRSQVVSRRMSAPAPALTGV